MSALTRLMPANHESLAIWVDANTWILSLKQWQLQAQAVTQQSLVDNLIFSKLKQNYSIWQFKLVEPSLFDIVLAKVVHKYALIDASFWQPLLYFFYLTDHPTLLIISICSEDCSSHCICSTVLPSSVSASTWTLQRSVVPPIVWWLTYTCVNLCLNNFTEFCI